MKLPIGIQDFETLRKEGCIYVDKTEYVHRIMQGAKYQFFARPRRFGKSLTVTTLKAAYEGKKELFGGLWLEEHYHFEPYTVLHINFTLLSGVELERSLLDFFRGEAKKNNIALDVSSVRDTFRWLIESLGRDKPVVLLIDEYDKPLVDNLSPDKATLRQTNQDVLRQLYGTLKGLDAYLHKVFLTGVSKFGKLNLFSDLNNVKDISLDESFAVLCGYTKSELGHYFAEYHVQAQHKLKLSAEEYWDTLQFWYNGYSWDAINTVYCPYSSLLFLSSPMFKGYWYETGTPTLLAQRIEQKKLNPMRFEHLYASDDVLTTASVDDLEPIGLMFQTGYLTIKHIDFSSRGVQYTLSYPNQEVKQAFSQQLISEYIHEARYGSFLGLNLGNALLAADWEGFFEEINTTLAGIPYDIFPKQEIYFNSLMHLMLVSTGIPTEGQVHTNRGRMDNVMEYEGKVYIFEYKLDSSAAVALQQIIDTGYAERYSGKVVTLLGVNFSSATKQVEGWEICRLG